MHAVEPRVAHHLDDGRHAAPLFADELGPGAVELDLARRVGAIAELVLQALDVASRCASPSGSQRGTKKQTSPRSVCASVRNASHIGAEQNHLWPVRLPVVARAASRASCWRARRSRPASRSSPCRRARPAFRSPARARGSYVQRRSAAAPTRAPATASMRSAGTARVGHRDRDSRSPPRPAPDEERERRARRARPRRGSRHGDACSPCSTPARISACHAGWNSTSSTRWPKRSNVRSFGGCSLACTPHGNRLAAGELADGVQPIDRPLRAFAARGVDERAIAAEEVVVDERRRLIEDFVRAAHAAKLALLVEKKRPRISPRALDCTD